MKILLVNCVYANGSTGKILRSLHHGLLGNGYDSNVFYSRGPKSNDINVNKPLHERIVQMQALASRITGFSYGCSPLTTLALKTHIKRLKPDIVNLHCINANTVNIVEILEWLKKNNLNTVITAHAEFLYTGGCAHSFDCKKWKFGCKECNYLGVEDSPLPTSYFFDKTASYWNGLERAYKNYNQLKATGVSPWLVNRMKESPFLKDKDIYWTPNGVNTSIFHPYETNHLRNKILNNQEGKIYIHLTPDFSSILKGGKYILEFARMLEFYSPGDKVIIVGRNIDKSLLPSNVIPISHTNNQKELAQLYSVADVTIIASSRETFSMVAAESLCSGTPVVGFKAGGPESICTKGHTAFVDYGDIQSLFNAAVSIPKTNNISHTYSQLFSDRAMVESYEKVYNSFFQS